MSDLFLAFKKNWSRVGLKLGDVGAQKGVLVACSSGLDSTALYHCFRLQQEVDKKEHRSWELGILHVNYGLRGDESNVEEGFLRSLALKAGHPFFGLKVSQAEREAQGENGIQLWARTIRYEFFNSFAAQGWIIALAHHEDDLAENILFRMSRGTGPARLCGMTLWSPPFIRPFINMQKKQLQGFMEERSYDFCEDSSNDKIKYSRNKIRHQVLPVLEELFPGAAKRIVRLGQKIENLAVVEVLELAKRLSEVQSPSQQNVLSRSVYDQLVQEGFYGTDIVNAWLKNLRLGQQGLASVHIEHIAARWQDKALGNEPWIITLPNLELVQGNQELMSWTRSVRLVRENKNKLTQERRLCSYGEIDLIIPAYIKNIEINLNSSDASNDESLSMALPFCEGSNEAAVEAREQTTEQTAELVVKFSQPSVHTQLVLSGYPRKTTLKEVFQVCKISIDQRKNFWIMDLNGECYLTDHVYIYLLDFKNKNLRILNKN